MTTEAAATGKPRSGQSRVHTIAVGLRCKTPSHGDKDTVATTLQTEQEEPPGWRIPMIWLLHHQTRGYGKVTKGDRQYMIKN